MSINVARRKRTSLYLSITGLMLVVAAISAVSARDPDGVTVRTGMILVTVGAAMWLPWQALIPATLAIWLGPNMGRNAIDGYDLFSTNMMLELPGFLGLAAMSTIARMSLRDLEQEDVMLGLNRDSTGLDPTTGVFEESQLRSALEVELSRSRRFGRTFALVLVGIDEMRQRFDYRDEEVWQASFAATAELLRGTRANVDRVYRYGPAGFALLLPESDRKDVNGLVRRLRRVARKSKPQEGEPGGPLPAHYGATFFPTCATTVEDLMRRAEIALRLSDNNANRVQLDGAEAPEMPPVETLRQPDLEIAKAVAEPLEIETDATPRLRIVRAPEDDELNETPVPAIAAPMAIVDANPAPAMDAPDAAAPEVMLPALATIENEPEAVDPAPTPLYAVSAAGADNAEEPHPSPNGVEVDGEHPFEVFAYRAPEPAVDVYNDNWQAEAPLSVIRRPHPTPKLVAVDGHAVKSQAQVEDAISDALKQLDGTLELIRSLKQRSA